MPTTNTTNTTNTTTTLAPTTTNNNSSEDLNAWHARLENDLVAIFAQLRSYQSILQPWRSVTPNYYGYKKDQIENFLITARAFKSALDSIKFDSQNRPFEGLVENYKHTVDLQENIKDFQDVLRHMPAPMEPELKGFRR